MMDDVEWLTAACAAYETDAPHTGPFAEEIQSYPPIDMEFWKRALAEPHNGDCTNEPQPCARCQAIRYRHFADWILDRATQEGHR